MIENDDHLTNDQSGDLSKNTEKNSQHELPAMLHERIGYRAVLGLLASKIVELKDRIRIKAEFRTNTQFNHVGLPPSNLQRENAQLALNFILCAFGKNEIVPIPQYLETALLEWKQQFVGMCRILSIDISMPSALDPGMSILESYEQRFAPYPQPLGLFIKEDDSEIGSNTIRKSSFAVSNGEPELIPGVFFPVELDENPTGDSVVVSHSSDHTKVHEDTHFLRMCMVGQESFFRDHAMAMIGEGLARLFELWYQASREKGYLLDEEAWGLLNGFLVPDSLRSFGAQMDDVDFWNKIKLGFQIRELSNLTDLSAEIMKFLRKNPSLRLSDFFKDYIASATKADFAAKLIVRGIDQADVEVFLSTFAGTNRWIE